MTPPIVTFVDPATTNSMAGGETIAVYGSGFTSAIAVRFGLAPESPRATTFTVVSDGELSVLTPPGLGTVDVIVTNAEGEDSAAGPDDEYTYPDAAPPFTVSAWVERHWDLAWRFTTAAFTAQQDVRLYLSEESADEYCCVHFGNADDGQALVWAEIADPRDGIEVDIGLIPGGLGDTAAILAEDEAARTELLAAAGPAFESVEWTRPMSAEDALMLPAPSSEGEELAVVIRLTVTSPAGDRWADYCLIDFAVAGRLQ